MPRFFRFLPVLCLPALLAAGPQDLDLQPWYPITDAHGEKAAQVHQRVMADFGSAIHRGLTNGNPVDAALLAQRLYDNATQTKDPIEKALLCQYAYSLGIRHTNGYVTCIKSAGMLNDLLPEAGHAWDLRLLNVLEKWHEQAFGNLKTQLRHRLVETLVTMGHERTLSRDDRSAARYYSRALRLAKLDGPEAADAIEPMWKAANERAKTALRVEAYEKRLQNNPGDFTAATELLPLYLIELDDPERALEVVKHTTDTQAKELVPIAAKPLNKIDEAQAQRLVRWYTALADRASAETARQAMLDRATVYEKHAFVLENGVDLAAVQQNEPATTTDSDLDLITGDLAKTHKPKFTDPTKPVVDPAGAQPRGPNYVPPQPTRIRRSDDEPQFERRPGFFGIPTN